jgi:N-acylglucosamine 2-epimerase
MSCLDWGVLADQHGSALLNDVIPFWLDHSLDREHGGYMHHLDRDGSPYCDEKMMWMQGRELYMFSRLYNEVPKRPEWLDAARLGAEFMRKYGRDENGWWYFLLDRKGAPIRVASNIFSDFFAVMAMLEYAKASGSAWAMELAVETFWSIIARRDNPKGRYNKLLPRPDMPSDHAFPMILLNVAEMMHSATREQRYDDIVTECIQRIMNRHVDPKRSRVFEYAWPDGSRPDSPAGRLINPGHAIESMRFVMEAAAKRGEREVVEKAAQAMLWICECGWDEGFGGFLYFVDDGGRPVEALEWNMKLWWPHAEALNGLLLAYAETGRAELANWYSRVADFTWRVFPDPEYGEWFGYFDRRGNRTHDMKGGKWKGCFHVPRSLLNCLQIAESMQRKNAS